MGIQEEAFLSGEGDAYHRRNRGASIAREHWFALLSGVWDRLPLRPGRILEIGCGAGENLAFLRDRYGLECHGVDPSREAVEEGVQRHPGLNLSVGIASKLPHGDGEFDCLLFGFCLYLCDRNALFAIAAEADRVLRPDGIVLILDFSPPFPYRNAYAHRPGLYSYKMRYRDMFLWNPAYSLAEVRGFSHTAAAFHPNPDERLELAALYKSNPDACWPIGPFAGGAAVEPR